MPRLGVASRRGAGGFRTESHSGPFRRSRANHLLEQAARDFIAPVALHFFGAAHERRRQRPHDKRKLLDPAPVDLHRSPKRRQGLRVPLTTSMDGREGEEGEDSSRCGVSPPAPAAGRRGSARRGRAKGGPRDTTTSRRAALPPEPESTGPTSVKRFAVAERRERDGVLGFPSQLEARPDGRLGVLELAEERT